jgi:predicted HAD superfamily Cof-like phosphohydrolase
MLIEKVNYNKVTLQNTYKMFELFKQKSAKDKLYEQYEQLMAQSHALTKTNRAESDKKYAEAQELIKQIDELES